MLWLQVMSMDASANTVSSAQQGNDMEEEHAKVLVTRSIPHLAHADSVWKHFTY